MSSRKKLIVLIIRRAIGFAVGNGNLDYTSYKTGIIFIPIGLKFNYNPAKVRNANACPRPLHALGNLSPR